MKIFSDDPKPSKMKADTFQRGFWNTVIGGIGAFLLSLAIPDQDFAQGIFAVLFVLIVGLLDLRDRICEIFHQNREILARPQVKFIQSANDNE